MTSSMPVMAAEPAAGGTEEAGAAETEEAPEEMPGEAEGAEEEEAVEAEAGAAVEAPAEEEGEVLQEGTPSEEEEEAPAEEIAEEELEELNAGYTGWKKEGGKTRYYKNGKMLKNTTSAEIDGGVYGFDENGVMRTGIYIYNPNHIDIKETEDFDPFDSRHALAYIYFGKDGRRLYTDGPYKVPEGTVCGNWDFLLAGFVKYEDAAYYFSPKTALMVTGWKTLSGHTYYFGKDGRMRTGWQTINGFKYYFGKDGIQRTGFQTIGGKKYYFFPKTSGKNYKGTMAKGWQTVNGKTCFCGSDGAIYTGWHTIAGKTYYFTSGGVMRTGWQTINGFKYYFGTDGAQRTGWQTIYGYRYYFFPKTSGNHYKGTMAKRWNTINGWKYYMGEDGVIRTGFHTIGGKKYYFYDGNKAMKEYEPNVGRALYRGTIPAPGFICINGANKIYYIQKDGSLATGRVKIKEDGWNVYTFSSSGLLK